MNDDINIPAWLYYSTCLLAGFGMAHMLFYIAILFQLLLENY